MSVAAGGGVGLLAELLAHPGVDERCELRGRFGFLALHGGNLERGTDEIAATAAERAGASLYAVCQPPDLRWHVPSIAYDPAESTALTRFLGHVDVVVAVHGYGREGMWTTLLVGGGNRALAGRLATALRAGLGDGFAVVDDLDAIPARLRGLHPRNPVNLAPGGGAQIELPPRVRTATGVPTHRPEYQAAIVDALVAVALAPGTPPGPDRAEAGPAAAGPPRQPGAPPASWWTDPGPEGQEAT